MFGLFRLLGYRFSPRLADVGGACFWRLDPKADYGLLNSISAHQLNLKRIAPHWDDMLRLAGSLKLGRVSAVGIMRTLQIGDKPTRLAQAIAEYGRIEIVYHRASCKLHSPLLVLWSSLIFTACPPATSYPTPTIYPWITKTKT